MSNNPLRALGGNTDQAPFDQACTRFLAAAFAEIDHLKPSHKAIIYQVQSYLTTILIERIDDQFLSQAGNNHDPDVNLIDLASLQCSPTIKSLETPALGGLTITKPRKKKGPASIDNTDTTTIETVHATAKPKTNQTASVIKEPRGAEWRGSIEESSKSNSSLGSQRGYYHPKCRPATEILAAVDERLRQRERRRAWEHAVAAAVARRTTNRGSAAIEAATRAAAPQPQKVLTVGDPTSYNRNMKEIVRLWEE